MKTKKETLELLENSISSIFSKDDVIKLINDLQDSGQPNSDLAEEILNELQQDQCSMYQDYGAEFRIDNYNEIYIDNVEMNWDYISECIDRVITKQ